MLKGAGYDVPYAVVASGMVKVEGKVFSKSRGYVIWVEEDYLDKGLDPDALRYYVASYTGFTRDLDFNWSAYGEKVNKELVGTLGNFLYRALLFAHRNYGAIPEWSPRSGQRWRRPSKPSGTASTSTSSRRSPTPCWPSPPTETATSSPGSLGS